MKLHPSTFLIFSLVAACSSSRAPAPTPGAIAFNGQDLSGWKVASTGGSGPDARWESRADKAAVSSPAVLSVDAPNHQSEDRFNVYWNESLRFGDGKLAVSVRADGGKVDQGGGPMWRVQDANNYYVCRFNPLEANYRVYVVKNGVRRQLATALAEVKVGEWHRLEVEHIGTQIHCKIDGKKLLEAADATIPAAGGVGLWTKADARTSFDDLVVEARKQ